MKKVVLIGAVAALFGCVSVPPLETVRFEAEDIVTNKDAWQENKSSENHWNLWSTDREKEKWSGGVVLQGPAAERDRRTGEEGAPVLHVLVPNLRNGLYDVYMGGARTVGVSRDGENWSRTRTGLLFGGPVKVTDGRFEFWVDDRYAHTGRPGPCYFDYLEFRPAQTAWRRAAPSYRIPSPADCPSVEGWAKTRREEVLDRGVIALNTPHGVYIGWRLLKNDPANVSFDIYRRLGNSAPEKLNATPISATTDFVDTTLPEEAEDVLYLVCPTGTKPDLNATGISAPLARPGSGSRTAPYVSIKLKDDKARFQNIAFADLNGDGKLDYIIKYPYGWIDPADSLWKPSPETYKLEAYMNDGTYLWTRDLGWSIERGVWYSPYVAADLNGDGKAEVAVKTGKGDPRDEDGRVRTGPEWLSIWDGMTGKRITRVPWPSRDGFANVYGRYCRNQLAVAYLDGKTPCVIALRGTYGLMKTDAYQLKGKKLKQLWSYSNEGLDAKYWGQGEHFTRAADVDGDGRDEILLGSVMLDDTGCPLWTTGMGHTDAAYISDVLPDRPGLEIYYVYEGRHPKNGMCLLDAKIGEIIWGYPEPTDDVQGVGMCADVDPFHPGMECWGANQGPKRQLTAGPWLWSAKGEMLAEADPSLPKSFEVTTVFWDADLQKEYLFKKNILDFWGGPVDGRVDGRVVMVADILGDWREEIITSVSGEIRIHTTTIPAMDRRVCLMQDPIYRADVRMMSMGYHWKMPSLSYCPAAESPNVNLMLPPEKDGKRTGRVVVSAPLKSALKGTVSLDGGPVTITPDTFEVDLRPGELKAFEADMRASADKKNEFAMIKATLTTADRSLCTRVPFSIPRSVYSKYRTSMPRVEAEAFSGQGGGRVRKRSDKEHVSGQCLSHWDKEGHWLEWKFSVPKEGRYELIFRYSATGEARREVTVDGRKLGVLEFSLTGGFGDSKKDWMEQVFHRFPEMGKLELSAGEHVLRATNIGNTSMNLDFIGYHRID